MVYHPLGLLEAFFWIFNRDIPHSNWLCEICETVVHISKTLAQNGKELPSNPHDFVEKFSCNSSKRECMYTNECNVFNVCISAENFERFKKGNFYSWQKVDGKVRKTCLTALHHELANMFNTQMPVPKKHILVKRKQNTFYNNVKDNLEENNCLFMLTIARTTATKINMKSKVPILGITHFQYSWLVAIFAETTEK